MDPHSPPPGPQPVPRSTREPAPLPQPGDVLLGCFRLERPIGVGSFATAYLAEQLGTDRRAVVKIPHPHLLDGPHGAELRRRFEAEAKAATRTQHPNLVTVYVTGDTPYGVPAMAMEHVAGDSLHERLTRTAPLGEAELLALGSQLADALATLHAAGIVHRDLSPSNVIVQRQPGPLRVKLLDFGVAKLLDAPSRTLGPMGTPGYLAPEQLLGGATPAVDVYSLGAVLWWALTGRERGDDYSDGSLRASVGRRVGPDPRAVRPGAPAGFASLVQRALTPEPRLRPSMAELARAWARAGDERAETLRPSPREGWPTARAERSGRWSPVSLEGLDTLDTTDTVAPRQSRGCTVDPDPRLRPGLIERMRTLAPARLVADLEAFIGSAPEWLARVDASLASAAQTGGCSAQGREALVAARSACDALHRAAESVGADSLACLVGAVADSLVHADHDSARVFLAACEREYFDVFQQAFVLLQQLQLREPSP